MSRFSRHVLAPLVATVAMFALYFMPKDVIGCANRGLAAFGLALLSLSVSFVMIGMAFARRSKGRSDSIWFILSAALLVLPAVLLLGPLG